MFVKFTSLQSTTYSFKSSDLFCSKPHFALVYSSIHLSQWQQSIDCTETLLNNLTKNVSYVFKTYSSLTCPIFDGWVPKLYHFNHPITLCSSPSISTAYKKILHYMLQLALSFTADVINHNVVKYTWRGSLNRLPDPRSPRYHQTRHCRNLIKCFFCWNLEPDRLKFLIVMIH